MANQKSRRAVLVLAVSTLFLGACRMLIGDLQNECEVDADCAAKGAGLACVEPGICVNNDGGPTTPPLMAGCKYVGPETAEITFGLVGQLTRPNDGGANTTGVLREQAAKLVIDQINPPTRTGVHNKSMKIISCDTVGVSTAASAIAEHLILQGVRAIMTQGSADTLAVAAKAIPANVLVMAISATSPEITGVNDAPTDGGSGLLWRVALSDAFQGKVIANELKSQDGGVSPRVAVIYLNDSYGQGLQGAFAANYPNASTLVSAFNYPRQGDIDTAVNAAFNMSPPADKGVLIGFPDDAARILNAAAAKGPPLSSLNWFFTDSAKSTALYTGVTSKPQVVDQFGTAPASAIRTLSDGGSTASPSGFYFLTQYKNTFGGQDPLAASFTANAFDATMLLAIGASYATSPGKAFNGQTMALAYTKISNGSATITPMDPTTFGSITTAIETGNTINVEGASGKLDYDPSGNGDILTGEIEVWQLKENSGVASFSTVKIISSQ
jgi:branched-chain amino acid transport system substrate-binding protein